MDIKTNTTELIILNWLTGKVKTYEAKGAVPLSELLKGLNLTEDQTLKALTFLKGFDLIEIEQETAEDPVSVWLTPHGENLRRQITHGG